MRVLIVEDHAPLANALSRVLKQVGCSTLVVQSVGEAKLLYSPDIRLAIVDEDLRGSSKGSELLAWLDEHHPEVRKIHTSGGQTESRWEFWIKPIDIGKLIEIARELEAVDIKQRYAQSP